MELPAPTTVQGHSRSTMRKSRKPEQKHARCGKFSLWKNTARRSAPAKKVANSVRVDLPFGAWSAYRNLLPFHSLRIFFL